MVKLAVKEKYANRFPRSRDMNHKVFTFRPHYLSDFFCARAVGQFDDSAQSARERWALKRLDQIKHRIAPAPAAVVTDLHGRENDAGGHRDCVDQIRKGGDVHVDQRGSVTRPMNKQAPLGTCWIA